MAMEYFGNNSLRKFLPGYLVAIALSLITFFLAPYLRIGTAITALILGMVLVLFLKDKKELINPGIGVIKSRGLEFAIFLFGFSITISHYGKALHLCLSVPIVVSFGLIGSYIIGRLFKLNQKESILLAFGNSICGSAAIVASSKIIDASSEEMGGTLSVVNLLGLLLLFCLPPCFSFFNQDPVTIAYISGATLQSVGHVGALGENFSSSIAVQALSFKMWRVLFLFPVCFILNKINSGLVSDHKKDKIKTKTPLYLYGFLAAVMIANIFPSTFYTQLATVGKYFLVLAMGAIGLSVDLVTLLKSAPRIFISGFFSMILILILNLAILSLF